MWKLKPDNIKKMLIHMYLNSRASGCAHEIAHHNTLFKLGQHVHGENANLLRHEIN